VDGIEDREGVGGIATQEAGFGAVVGVGGGAVVGGVEPGAADDGGPGGAGGVLEIRRFPEAEADAEVGALGVGEVGGVEEGLDGGGTGEEEIGVGVVGGLGLLCLFVLGGGLGWHLGLGCWLGLGRECAGAEGERQEEGVSEHGVWLGSDHADSFRAW
jgi:hypothetical protein